MQLESHLFLSSMESWKFHTFVHSRSKIEKIISFIHEITHRPFPCCALVYTQQLNTKKERKNLFHHTKEKTIFKSNLRHEIHDKTRTFYDISDANTSKFQLTLIWRITSPWNYLILKN